MDWNVVAENLEEAARMLISPFKNGYPGVCPRWLLPMAHTLEAELGGEGFPRKLGEVSAVWETWWRASLGRTRGLSFCKACGRDRPVRARAQHELGPLFASVLPCCVFKVRGENHWGLDNFLKSTRNLQEWNDGVGISQVAMRMGKGNKRLILAF